MQLAFGRLLIPPGDFWAMTPREFSAAVRGAFGEAMQEPLAREGLHALMGRYPD